MGKREEGKETKALLLSFCLFLAIPSRASPKHPASADAFSSTYKSYQRSRWCRPVCIHTSFIHVDRAATGSHKLTCKSRVPHTRLFLPWRTLRWEKKTLELDGYARPPIRIPTKQTRRAGSDRGIVFLSISFFLFFKYVYTVVANLRYDRSEEDSVTESKKMIRSKNVTLEVWFLKISSSRNLFATLPSDRNCRDFTRGFLRFESSSILS